MRFILIPFAVALFSQGIKFLILSFRGRSGLADLFWASGPPSGHTALLASFAYLIWQREGTSPLFAFCLVMSAIVIYEVFKNKRRAVQFDLQSGGATKTVESNGHTAFDVILGILFGVILTFFLS